METTVGPFRNAKEFEEAAMHCRDTSEMKPYVEALVRQAKAGDYWAIRFMFQQLEELQEKGIKLEWGSWNGGAAS
jgi:hypothetical protein